MTGGCDPPTNLTAFRGSALLRIDASSSCTQRSINSTAVTLKVDRQVDEHPWCAAPDRTRQRRIADRAYGARARAISRSNRLHSRPWAVPFSAYARTALVGAQVMAGPAGKTASVLAFARKLGRSLGSRGFVGCSSKPSDGHEPPLSDEQLALNTQQHVARSRGRDGSEPRLASDGDGCQKLRLLLRRQSDGGIVGFAAATRQRPSLSRSTTPRLASRPSRMETALFSHWVAFAHWTTPASGWSRIASKSARSHAASSTPGPTPRCRLERELGVP
jgi:hypothetical protein